MGHVRHAAALAGAVAVLIIAAGVHCSSFSEQEPVAADAPGDTTSTSDASSEDSAPFDATTADVSGDSDKDAALPPICGGDPNCERVVFVTKSPVKGGAIGGLVGGDGICTTAAASANAAPRVKGRIFNAWLSTDTTPVSGRLPIGTQAYVRPDGKLIAVDWPDLTNGSIANAISQDQEGKLVGSVKVWTGTNELGGVFGGSTCGDWMNLGVSGQYGTSSSVNDDWTVFGDLNCDQLAHLYCVEH